MLFLAAHIFVWILAAFAFGGIIGWWLHRLVIKEEEETYSITSNKGAGANSVSVLSDSLLQTQRELQECQQSLAFAETRLKEMNVRFPGTPDTGEAHETEETDEFGYSSDESVYDDNFESGQFEGGQFEGSSFEGGQFESSNFESGNFESGNFESDEVTELQGDDLKLIPGIGPYIEKKLYELDISTYEQIARLSEEDMIRIGNHINYFPGRITRDGWIENAKRLHKEKYGEEV